MSDWVKGKLSNVATIYSGYAFKGKDMNNESGIPLIKIKNINFSRVSKKCDSFLNKEAFTGRQEKYKLLRGDILVAMTGQGSVGRIGKMRGVDKTYLVNQRVGIVRVDKALANAEYVYQYMGRKSIESIYYSLAMGAGQPNLSPADIGNLTIYYPPPPTQQKIAKILSNYDDLIENNLKRIKLLEESARLTYEEWFLRFRVDGKKLEIDPESSLPFEWKRLKVNDYVDTISKGPSLNYDLGESKGVQVLNQSCIRNGEIELDKVLIAKELNDNKKSSYLRINDILINSMGQGTLGRVSKNVSIDEKMIIHNCITYLRAKDIYSQYMLFYFISSHKEYFESLAQGSTGQSTLKKELVSNLLITLPDDKTINRYDLIISSAWNKIGALKKQNKLLKEARDILLPRLMTGMIDTDDMDIAV